MLLAGIIIYAATIAGFVWYLKRLSRKENSPIANSKQTGETVPDFKVGDRVIVTDCDGSHYYKTGASGVVASIADDGCWVAFDSGEYNSSIDSRWHVPAHLLELASYKHPAMTAPITRKCDIKAVAQEVLPPEVKIPRGWKRADGKTRHVKSGKVDIIQRDGIKTLDAPADLITEILWSTEHAVTPYDIIAYRVRKPVKNQGVFSANGTGTKKRKTVTVTKRK
jgi:hypothetical protein